MVSHVDRLTQVEAAIARFAAENDYSPTVRQIADMVGLRSSSSTHRYLRMLVEEGRVRAPDRPGAGWRLTAAARSR